MILRAAAPASGEIAGALLYAWRNMTDENTAGRALPVRDRSGTAEAIARPLTDEERASGLPCWVRHPNAGGLCGRRPATTMVYGLLFCEVHGAEARAGALAELYKDAGDFLGTLDNPHVPRPNAEALRALRAAREDLETRGREHEDAEDAALGRAYPTIPERVCRETVGFDYRLGPDNMFGPREQPTDVYRDARHLLCKQLRLAYEESADWLVEVLEYEREAASAQLAFALEDYERKMGTPEERARWREEARARRDPAARDLASINSSLTAAHGRLDIALPEAFADEEDYWRVKSLIARAGSIVARQQHRAVRPGDGPGEEPTE